MSVLSGSSDSEQKKVTDKRTDVTSGKPEEYQHLYLEQNDKLDNPLLWFYTNRTSKYLLKTIYYWVLYMEGM